MVGFLAAALVALPAIGKVGTWRQDTAEAFRQGTRQGLVVLETGRVRLAPVLRKTGSLNGERVWDVLEHEGKLYAATGDRGRVYRRDAGEAGTWELVAQDVDSQILSLAVLGDAVVAGTGSGGRLIWVEGSKRAAEKLGESVQYVWDLASGPEGALYAATGPEGQLWKRTAAGKWQLLFDARQTHLLSVAVGADGTVFTGSDRDGVLYRVDAAGRVSVVYDTPGSEIRALAISPEGVIYLGTGSEVPGSGSGSGSGSGGNAGSGSGQTMRELPGRPGGGFSASGIVPAIVAMQEVPVGGEDRPRAAASAEGGTAAPKALGPGENGLYRIRSNGVAREIWRTKGSIHAIAAQGGRLLVGTGPEGMIHEVREEPAVSGLLARLDHGHVLALRRGAGGMVWLGAGEPAGVIGLTERFVSEGTLISAVHDMKLPSRVGQVEVEVDQPEGTSLGLAVRTGDSAEPDGTWSDWVGIESGEDGEAGRVIAPGRYVQTRVILRTQSGARSPEVRSILVSYRSMNLPPELGRISLEEPTAKEPSARSTRLGFKWEASDPNEDELEYCVAIQKEGWPGWVEIVKSPITERNWIWDTSTVPAGRYRLRVEASDRRSNRPEEALERRVESEPFVVDHEPPRVTIERVGDHLRIRLEERWTKVASAAVSVDGGDWVALFPEDRIFDAKREEIIWKLPESLREGTHIVVVRASDSAGNVGAADLVLGAAPAAETGPKP
jgi:hypothetical protein